MGRSGVRATRVHDVLPRSICDFWTMPPEATCPIMWMWDKNKTNAGSRA